MEKRIKELDNSLDMKDFEEEEEEKKNVGMLEGQKQQGRIGGSSDYLEIEDPPQERVILEREPESSDQKLIQTMR